MSKMSKMSEMPGMGCAARGICGGFGVATVRCQDVQDVKTSRFRGRGVWLVRCPMDSGWWAEDVKMSQDVKLSKMSKMSKMSGAVPVIREMCGGLRVMFVRCPDVKMSRCMGRGV